MSNQEHQDIPDSAPVILDRSHHPISRRNIDPDALKVLYRLHNHGFIAYLVGGAVRDLMLGRTPQDFDVGTNARPRQIKKLFRNAYLIGRRFRLAQVRFQGGKVIEVATFRREPEPEEIEESEESRTLEEERSGPEEEVSPAPEGQPLERPALDRSFGTPRQDAFRRDITINALFYDIATFSVIDYVGGLEDLAGHKIRVIGNPGQRYIEDPVRMWRVLRHAARLGFTLEEKTEQAISGQRHLLAACSGSRLFDELNKDLKSGAAEPFFRLARQHDLIRPLLGRIGEFIQSSPKALDQTCSRLAVLDSTLSSGVSLSQVESYALLFWAWAATQMAEATGDRAKYLHQAFHASGTTMTLPRALIANVIQTMIIVERMLRALDSGQMRWSLRRRAHYPEATRVCSLLVRGELTEDKDPFDVLFRQKYGRAPGLERAKRRRRHHWKKKPPQGPPPQNPAH